MTRDESSDHESPKGPVVPGGRKTLLALAVLVFVSLHLSTGYAPGLLLIAVGVAVVWGVCEAVPLARRFGWMGYGCLVVAVAACLPVLYREYTGYQVQQRLIGRIEALGADGAYQGSARPSAPVDYIYLGEEVGNEELREIANLEGLDHLERLVIVESRITDEGLVHLTKFPRLRDVYFRGTRVSEAGVERLRRELPECEIVVEREERESARGR